MLSKANEIFLGYFSPTFHLFDNDINEFRSDLSDLSDRSRGVPVQGVPQTAGFVDA